MIFLHNNMERTEFAGLYFQALADGIAWEIGGRNKSPRKNPEGEADVQHGQIRN